MFGVKQKNASCCCLVIDALRSEDALDYTDRAGLDNTKILTLATVVKHRLFSWSRFRPNLLTTFLRMLAEPFKSALITMTDLNVCCIRVDGNDLATIDFEIDGSKDKSKFPVRSFSVLKNVWRAK
jgi:hypothetical protein